MIDLEFLEKLIRALDESGLDHIEIERGGTRIRVSRSPVPGPVAPAMQPAASGSPALGANPEAAAFAAGAPRGSESGRSSSDEELAEITSPMVGTFFRAPSPGADPFTEVGKRISKGDPLCIIEAMKLMNELESELEGTVREVCVANGDPVEYGQVLFRVELA
jgi:acetyl-CoA carboxylase biotin carboxyl carrier protein